MKTLNTLLVIMTLSIPTYGMQEASYTPERPEMVTKLDLRAHNLTELSVLQTYPNLTELELSGNSLRSLRGIEHLTQLKFLNLLDNQYLDEISPLTALTNLEELNLIYTANGHLSFLSVLPNLRKLMVSSNMVTPKSFIGLTQLQTLKIHGYLNEEEKIKIRETFPDLPNLIWN